MTSTAGFSFNFLMIACSRPPPPTTISFILVSSPRRLLRPRAVFSFVHRSPFQKGIEKDFHRLYQQAAPPLSGHPLRP